MYEVIYQLKDGDYKTDSIIEEYASIVELNTYIEECPLDFVLLQIKQTE